MSRRPTASQTRRSLKRLIDSAAGYKIDRRAELEAVIAVANSSFPALMKAFWPCRSARTITSESGFIVTQIAEPGFLAQERAELQSLDGG
jgi:hypothetical protein